MTIDDLVRNGKELLERLLRHEAHILHNADWVASREAQFTGLALCLCGVLLSFVHVYGHLRQFTMPQIQVYIVRIILTCPVYSVTSTLALFMGPYSAYAEVLRDVYEAIVIYSFFNLILEYGGGETDCVYAIENEGMMKLPCPLCCLKPRNRNAKLLRFCHRGVLQFIITKPIVAFFDIIFLAAGIYHHQVWQILQMLIYNISYAWALYCLAVFYMAVKNVISQFRPIAKFAAVKMVIFATYYQSLLLRVVLAKPSTAIEWNNLLLCLEMVFFSLAFMIAFPVQEFLGGIPDRRVLRNLKEVFTFRDVVHNIYYNFNPNYQDYALQSSQLEVPSSINERTDMMTGKLGHVAKEMAERYRGRSHKKSFNALMRGSNPITAKIRRRSGLQSNNSSQHSSQADSDDDLMMAERGEAVSQSVANPINFCSMHSIEEEKTPFDEGGGGSEDDHSSGRGMGERTEMREEEVLRNGSSTGSMGRLPLRIKAKVGQGPGMNVTPREGSKLSPQEAQGRKALSNSLHVDRTELPKESLHGQPAAVCSPTLYRCASGADPFNSPSIEWTEYAEYEVGADGGEEREELVEEQEEEEDVVVIELGGAGPEGGAI